MAFLKGKYVQSGTLDGSKIKLKNQDPLKGTNADGSEKEILKVNGQDKVEFPEAPVVSQDPQTDSELARKAYVDAQREAAKAHADAAVSAEQALRQAADSALDQRVATLESSTSDRDYVDGKVAQEKSEREAADAALDTRLDTLEADAVTKAYVDAGDQASKDYADQKIADLVNSAPETLDTLKELADAIAAGETVSQGLLTLIGQTDAKVDAEILNRQSADQVLDDKVDQEIADRQAADSALDLRLDALEADPVTKTYVDQKDAELSARVSAMEAYDKETVYVDSVNGVDEASRGTLLRPFKTINYAYAQVSSASADLTKWASEKLIISLAAGNYTEEVVIGFKRARVAVVGDGVFISGGLTVKMLKEETPTITAGGLPAPWTGDNVRATFEMVGTGGGMEGGYVSKNIIVNGQVKLLSESWANASSWQFGGALSHYVFMSNVQLRAGLISVHDSKAFTGTVGPNITAEIDSCSIEGGYLGAQPLTAGANMLTGTNHQFNIKAHNSQLKSTIGPRATILEIDGCRVMNIDRTMGGTVAGSQDAAGVTAQDSSSYSGIVNSPFAGTVYKLGRTTTAGAVTLRMDANSYASLIGKTIDAGASTLSYNLIDKASGVSVALAPTNYSKATSDAEAHFAGINTALGLKADKSALDSEIAARQAGDSAVQANVTALAGVVQGNFDLQQSDIDGLRTDIEAEQVARAAADTALDGKIDAEKARIDAILIASDADKDSFAEIVQLINSVDTENDAAFASYVLSNNAALAQETADRQAADETFLKLDGTREMTGHLEMGAKKIKNAEGIMLGHDGDPAARVHIVDGNQLIEGGGETAVVMKRGGAVGDTLNPIFALGRIVAGGIMQPVYRLLYSDDAKAERSVFEVESTGTVASVSDGTRRSHFEAYVNNGDSEPAFRLNSYPDMGLELGAGGSSQTDVAFRRNGSYSAKVEIGGDAKTIWHPDNVVIQGGAGLVMSGQRIKQVGTPTEDTDAATKAYVDAEKARAESAEAALDTRLDVLEAAPALRSHKELKTLTAQDIANGYIDLACKAEAMSMILYVGGLAHHEGVDYTLSLQGSVTRVTFAGDLMPPSYGALLEGDMVRVQYMTKDADQSSGGGGGGSGGGGGEVPVAPVVQSVTVLPQSEVYSTVQVAWTGTATGFDIIKYDGPEYGWSAWVAGALSSSPATIIDIPRAHSSEPDENSNYRIILYNVVDGVPYLSQAFDFSLPKRASGGDPEAEIPASGQVISGLNVENNGITFTNVEFIKLFFPGTTDEITQSSKVRISYTSPVPLENMYLEFFINGQWTETYNQGRPDGLTSSPMTANITRGYSYRLKLKNSSGVESGVLEFNVGY
jgi:hypothetical protein